MILSHGRKELSPLAECSLTAHLCFRTPKHLDLQDSSEQEEEKAMAPHSSTLAWKTLWMEEPGRLQSMGSLRVRTTERLHFHFSLS